MMNPISPEFQHIIYKQREKELELAIERRLAREARGEKEVTQRANPWYIQAGQWLKARLPFPAFQKQVAAKQRVAAKPVYTEERCSEVPC